MNKVIITGATSLLGIALIEKCIENDVEVLAIVRKGSPNLHRLPVQGVIAIECDLEELNMLELDQQDCDVFYHLAWSGTDKTERENTERQLQNIKYTLDALELAVKLGCKKFIGAGSQAEYGIHLNEKTRIDDPLNPIEAYGICKAAAGKLCLIEAHKKNIKFSWVRIFSLYGKYEHRDTLIQTSIYRMLENKECFLDRPTQMWDYLHSEDAGRAFYMLGKKDAEGHFYCLGSGKAYPLQQYIEEIKRIVGSKSELKCDVNIVDRSNENGMCADISNLQEDLGWEPKITFDMGIALEIERIKGSR